MTFRQIIDVLWSRRLLIVVMVVVAVGVAIGYLQLRTVPYTSTEVVRENALYTQASQTGQLAGVQVDFDPTTLTTERILGPAARSIGLPQNALLGAVTYTSTAADQAVQPTQTQTTTIDISATGATPAAAQARAVAVTKQYTNYLQSQVSSALSTLTKRQGALAKVAQQYQAKVTANPRDTISQSNLSTTLASLGNLGDQVQSAQNAGSPLVVMTAAQPGAPVGPGRSTVLLVALAAGLIAGFGVALIREQFDDKLRGEHEFETLTGLRSLGELPFDRRVARGRNPLPAAGTEPTALLEAMRAVRTSIQVLLPPSDRGGHAILVTSAEAGDGKTFVAANLALSFARAGKKVVLVDGDLRRPSLRRYFLDAADGDGFATLLDRSSTGKTFNARDVESELRTTPYAGLRILPAGETVEAVGDLLAASDVGHVISQLRSIADVVVIDSPPSLTVVDATLLAKQVDGVVLVGSVGKVDRNQLAGAVDALRQNGVPLLGVVANRGRRAVPKPDQAYYIAGAARRVA